MKFNGSSWSQQWEQKVITFAKTLPDHSKGTLDMSTMFQRATFCDKVRSLQHKNIINLEKMLLWFSPATFGFTVYVLMYTTYMVCAECCHHDFVMFLVS